MSDPLQFTLLPLTPTHLEIKVKNTGTATLDQTLVINIYPPASIVTKDVTEAAKRAAKSKKPAGTASLDGIVTGPSDWTTWARRESSDSSLVVVLFNDMDKAGDLKDPVELAAGAEFVIRIPVNELAAKVTATIPYSYQHGVEEGDKPVTGKLELKAADVKDLPNVTLKVAHDTPMMIPAGTLVKISWVIEQGVSATLRGPLQGGNSELALSSNPRADFKIAGGAIEVRVVGSMTYVLQAEVKRPGGGPNIEITRVLSLDVANNKYTYLNPRTLTVLPHGLIEIDWAAWGVKQVIITVSEHSTRVINLTQQTMGRSSEGTGIMRVSARNALESITLTTQPVLDKQKQKTVTVVSWQKMGKPDIGLYPSGIAVIAPKMAVLALDGLFIADVGEFDPEDPLLKLKFELKTKKEPIQWRALTAADGRFVVMRRIDPNPDYEIAPFTIEGNPDVMTPVTLPREVVNIALDPHVIVDFVGFGKRTYLVLEVAQRAGIVRRAFSIGFDATTKKGDIRPEPLLESLVNYRLVTFDGGLYALSTESGRMFRFNVTNAGALDKPLEAATAVKKLDGNKEEPMVTKGMIVSVGRMLVVMSPTSVPTLAQLEEQGLKNVLSYQTTKAPSDEVPQDLLYNPLKDFWTRCGHGLDMKPEAVVAFRPEGSPRLWVIQPDGEMYTLAVGSESLFAPDYVLDFPTKSIPPYLTKKRQFAIKFSGVKLTPISDKNFNFPMGMREFVTRGPVEIPPRPAQAMTEYSFELTYNEANPTPVVLQLQVSPEQRSRQDADYFMELTFSGPDLATASSVYKRLTINQGRVVFDELPNTRKQYSGTGPIEVPKPAKFD